MLFDCLDKESTMQKNTQMAKAPGSRLNSDFWKYWTGQTISNLGSSVTLFALPLLVYKLEAVSKEPSRLAFCVVF